MSKVLFLVGLLILSVAYTATIPLESGSDTQSDEFNFSIPPKQKQKNSVRTRSTTQTLPCDQKPFCGFADNFNSTDELLLFNLRNCSTIVSCFPRISRFTGIIDDENPETEFNRNQILKTDDEYIYTVSGMILSILKASNEPEVLSTIQYTQNPREILLEGNNLAVFGDGWVNIYDVSNRSDPYIIREYQMSGVFFKVKKDQSSGFVYLFTGQSCKTTGTDNFVPWYQVDGQRKQFNLSQIFYYKNINYVWFAATINIMAFNLIYPQGNEENMISVMIPTTFVLEMFGNSIYLASPEIQNGVQVTKIHKIFVSGSTMIPMADGVVPGRIEKQFLINESNGILTIVTNENDFTQVSLNSVFCLDSTLNQLGRVRNVTTDIVKNGIQSAYFTTDSRLYLITSNKKNSYFVIDLYDPQDPISLGQLRLVGYPNSLMPYDTNIVMAFGQTPSNPPRLKVSLFNVADVTKSKRIAEYILPPAYTYLSADWAHKAFLFDKQKNLMVIRAKNYNWQRDSGYGPNAFNGALVFYVRRNGKKSGIVLKAMVNHLLSSTDEFSERYIQRSFSIGNQLFTKSEGLLRIHDLEKMKATANMELNSFYGTQQVFKPKTGQMRTSLVPLQLSGPGRIPVI